MTIVDRRYSVAEGTAVKAPVRAATTANIALTGEQTIDGIAVVDGDRVLVKNQSTASENGIYQASTGNWERTRDFDGALDVVTGTRVFVTAGTANGGAEFVVSTVGEITIGSTNITFTSITAVAVDAAEDAVAAAAVAVAAQAAAEAAAALFATLDTERVAGRDSPGTGDVEQLTITQVLDFIGSIVRGDIAYRGAAAWARLGAGVVGQVLLTGGAGADPSWGTQPILHVRDEKASTTNGQSLTVTTWNKRDLTTAVTNEITGASLASSQITLPAGVYEMEAFAPMFFQNNGDVTGQLRLRNMTDSTTALTGMSWNQNGSGVNVGTSSVLTLRGRFTIADAKVFEIQHYVGLQSGALGGKAASTGVGERYTDAIIRKVG